MNKLYLSLSACIFVMAACAVIGGIIGNFIYTALF
jgi:hypothetical protein